VNTCAGPSTDAKTRLDTGAGGTAGDRAAINAFRPSGVRPVGPEEGAAQPNTTMDESTSESVFTKFSLFQRTQPIRFNYDTGGRASLDRTHRLPIPYASA
jgi:hypothetical protein